MVKVKLIKATNEYDKRFLGGVFEAFEANYASSEKLYILNVGGSILMVDSENCEVVETEKCEKCEQLQAQLDCTNANYNKLNEKYMIAQLALEKACEFIEEYTPGVYTAMEALSDKSLIDLFWIKAENLLKERTK